MQTCPPAEHLKQFLDEKLSAPDTAALAEHIETCAACRRALDVLSADPDSKNWRLLRERAPQTADEPRPDFLRRLGSVLAPGSALSRAAFESTRTHTPAARGEPLPHPAGYEILEQRGHGGTGVVYKARDLRLKRTVALKMLLTGRAATPEERARLRTEAEAVARLQHPNIVQIHEIGEQDGYPFLVLEFVEGRSLAEHLDGTPQPPAVAAELLETVARAMYYAHQHGVVHRDLKPGNILLQVGSGQWTVGSEDKNDKSNSSSLSPAELPTAHCPLSALSPKVTDFGLAKRLDEQSQTQTGQILGTPSYMAPEQARGQSKSIGPAADIYALGAILYQMLTGRPPFQGVTSVDTIMQVLHDEPVPPRRLQPAVPRDLETICLKCLAKESEKRYASAQDLAEDLRRFRAGEPIRARPVGLIGHGRRWVRRNRALSAVLAALVAVLVVGFAGVVWSYLGAEAARKSEEQAHQKEAEQRELAEAHLYYSRVALAEREWNANNVARAEYLLDLCVPADGQRDRRGWEWYYLKRLCHADLKTIPAHRFQITGLAFSPNGKYLATTAGDRGYTTITRTLPGELTIWDAERFEPLATCAGHTGTVEGVTFDFASARFASISTDNTVRLWNVPSGPLSEPLKPFKTFPVDIHAHWRGTCAAFSQDGNTLAVPTRGKLRSIDLVTGYESNIPSDLKQWIGPYVLSPDGTLLATAGADKEKGTDKETPALIVWNAITKCERYRLPVDTFSVAFSPDGKLLATADGSGVLLVEARTGQKVRTLYGHDGKVTDLAFSPDGRFIASVSVDQVVRIWDVELGREDRIFRGHTGAVFRVAWHPNGQYIVSGDESGTLKVWDANRDQRVLVLPSVGKAGDVTFTADGTGVRAVSSDKCQNWELTTQRETFAHHVGVPWHNEWPIHPRALSTDGRFCVGPDPADQRTLCVWNVETGAPPLKVAGHQVGIRTVVVSPDGRRAASGSGVVSQTASGTIGHMEPRELFLWQFPESGRGEPSRIALPCESVPQSLAFSADSRLLVVGERGVVSADGKTWTDGCLSVWEATTGKLVRRWVAHPGTIQSVAFDPKGRWIASVGRAKDRTIRLWNAETGELLHTFGGPRALTCVTFNPDGTRLAAVGYEGWVHLMDPATGLDILTLRGPGARMPDGEVNDTRVVFSPDGTRMAVNSWTKAIYIWDARPLDK